MKNEYGIVGVAQHRFRRQMIFKKDNQIFIKVLDCEEILETYNEKAKEKVAFLQIQITVSEWFENGRR